MKKCKYLFDKNHCEKKTKELPTVFSPIKVAFEKAHPDHFCIPNKECPFFPFEDFDLCPYFEEDSSEV